jgi:hypothetical protein
MHTHPIAYGSAMLLSYAFDLAALLLKKALLLLAKIGYISDAS